MYRMEWVHHAGHLYSAVALPYDIKNIIFNPVLAAALWTRQCLKTQHHCTQHSANYRYKYIAHSTYCPIPPSNYFRSHITEISTSAVCPLSTYASDMRHNSCNITSLETCQQKSKHVSYNKCFPCMFL